MHVVLTRTPQGERGVAFAPDRWPHIVQTQMSPTNVDNLWFYFKSKDGMLHVLGLHLIFKLPVSQKRIMVKVVYNFAFGARNVHIY